MRHVDTKQVDPDYTATRGPGRPAVPERRLFAAIIEDAVEAARKGEAEAREFFETADGLADFYCEALGLDRIAILTRERPWWTAPIRQRAVRPCPGVPGRTCRAMMPAGWKRCSNCGKHERRQNAALRRRTDLHPCPGVPGTRREGCGVPTYGARCKHCVRLAAARNGVAA